MTRIKILFKAFMEGFLSVYIAKAMYTSQLKAYSLRGWNLEAYSFQKIPNKMDFIVFGIILFCVLLGLTLLKEYIRSRKANKISASVTAA